MRMTIRLILLLTLIFSCELATAQNCFPGNRWINCLLNTCTIYKKCPGDPTATCTIKRTECGCEANWYKPNGEIAQCDVRQNLRLCPGGERVVSCNVDLCTWPCNHPGFANAPCRLNRCGKCTAEYYVKDSWEACPTSVHPAAVAAGMRPISTDVGAVSDPSSCNFVPCNIKICINEKCPLEPRAVCRPDGCNECKPAWYFNDIPVRCYKETPLVTSKVFPEIGSYVCPAGQKTVACDQTVCDKKQCRNYPNAICRPDGCGECKDTWFVGDKQVDCLSDECPPDVPFVKCQDDPCKYFSHYCPDAVCRASQCGSCEAKFYVNGVEIDCAMPPKACPAGVKPKTCKWFTCPANICPSNTRLMCRIDPCGPTCSHDWVDIYNGEIMTCRTFDGDGRTIKQKSSKIYLTDPLSPFFTAHGADKDSSLHGTNNPAPKKPYPEPQHPISVITGNAAITGSLGQNTPEMNTKFDVVVSRGPGRFRVEPIFMQPRQVLSNDDLYALLSAYEHELMGISSLSIQNALRNQKNLDASFPLPDIPLSPVASLTRIKPEPVVAKTEKRGLALPGVARKLKLTASINTEAQPALVENTPVMSDTVLDTIGMVTDPDKAMTVEKKQRQESVPNINPNNVGIAGPFMNEQLHMSKEGVAGSASALETLMQTPAARDVSLGLSSNDFTPLGDVGTKSEFPTNQGPDSFGTETSALDMTGDMFQSLDNTPVMFDQRLGTSGTVNSFHDPTGKMMIGSQKSIGSPGINPDKQTASLTIVNTNNDQSNTIQQAFDGPATLDQAQSQPEAINLASGQLGNLNSALAELRTLYPELDPFGNMLSEPGNTNTGLEQQLNSGSLTTEQQMAVDTGNFDLGSPLLATAPLIRQNQLIKPPWFSPQANEKSVNSNPSDTASIQIASDPAIGQNESGKTAMGAPLTGLGSPQVESGPLIRQNQLIKPPWFSPSANENSAKSEEIETASLQISSSPVISQHELGKAVLGAQSNEQTNDKIAKTLHLGHGPSEGKPVKVEGEKGVPISMDMFQQWGIN